MSDDDLVERVAEKAEPVAWRNNRTTAEEFCNDAFGPFGVDLEPYIKIVTELLDHAAPARRCDAKSAEVVAAVQQAITKHPMWGPGLGSSAFAFGLANTAIDAYIRALSEPKLVQWEVSPGEFIRDEMAARGWSIEDMHAKLDNDPFRCCCFDLIAFVDKKQLVLDERTAGDLAQLFGVSSLYWMRLDRAWRGIPEDKANVG